MPETVFGLPAHPLIVHATVVLVPLGVLLVLLHALWPAARRRGRRLNPASPSWRRSCRRPTVAA